MSSRMKDSIEYHVIWKHNGSEVSFEDHLSNNTLVVFTATYIGHKHFLIAIAPTSNHSGNYSCTLHTQTNQTISSSVEVSIQPGTNVVVLSQSIILYCIELMPYDHVLVLYTVCQTL